ncbi:MAG: SPOR domain-containing protein [Gemmatimonadaceae bacterium]
MRQGASRAPVAGIGLLAALAAGIWAASACAPGDDAAARTRSAPEPGGVAPSTAAAPRDDIPLRFYALQLAAMSSVEGAERMRDSLVRQGWPAFVTRMMAGGKAVWRVRITPAADSMLPRLVLVALKERYPRLWGVVLPDSVPPAVLSGMVSTVTPVNRGSHGMTARVRWTMSADSAALLAVEDPTAVENDPVPNGFALALDANPECCVQMDSVWDVAPSPDWRRVAFGRAYLISGGGGDSLTSAHWATLTARVGLPARDVRAGAFPASGMASIWGFSRPGVIGTRARATPTLFPLAAGWRVSWSADGSQLAAGAKPGERIADDAPAERWIALDPANGALRGELPDGARLAPLRWTDGPAVDATTTLDTAARSALVTRGGRIESGGGWIRRNGRIVAPGTALASTRSGRHILALVPNPDAREFEPKVHLVVLSLLP